MFVQTVCGCLLAAHDEMEDYTGATLHTPRQNRESRMRAASVAYLGRLRSKSNVRGLRKNISSDFSLFRAESTSLLPYNSATEALEGDRQPDKVATDSTTAIPVSKEQLEEGINLLMGRAMEAEAVLRIDFSKTGCIAEMTEKLQRCVECHENLLMLASQLEVIKGAAFQELLGRGTGNPRGHINREDRIRGKVKLDEALDTEALEAAILGAEAFCDLVRIKIEDDNDLELALHVVEDSAAFLVDTKRIAAIKQQDEHEFLQTLRL